MSSVEDSENRIIDKTRFQTFNKVKAAVRKDYPEITDKEIRNIISRRNHDVRPNKIFSRGRNSWFEDLYDNLGGHEPDKTKNSIHRVLVRFLNECHPRKLTHEEEKGLVADINVNYLKDHKCALFIVQEQLHSTLGINDRFIRTIRDTNRPVERPVTDESTDEQFKFISRDKMAKILESYNNTVHSSTGLTPKQMMDFILN